VCNRAARVVSAVRYVSPLSRFFIFGRPFVKRFALCMYRTVVLSCLSVCDVGVLWPNGWTDQDETWHAVGLGPGHIVLDGNPAPLPKRGKGTASPIFGSYQLSQNCWMDQDATWYGGRHLPKRHCVRWGPSSPTHHQKGA